MPLVHDPLRYATHQCGLANLCRTCLGHSLALEPSIATAASRDFISLLTPPLPRVLRLALPVLLIFRPVSCGLSRLIHCPDNMKLDSLSPNGVRNWASVRWAPTECPSRVHLLGECHPYTCTAIASTLRCAPLPTFAFVLSPLRLPLSSRAIRPVLRRYQRRNN